VGPGQSIHGDAGDPEDRRVRCGMKTKAPRRPLPDDEARDRDALRYDARRQLVSSRINLCEQLSTDAVVLLRGRRAPTSGRGGLSGGFAGRRFRMRDQIDIDKTLSRAIIREIGERLRASLGEDELPSSLRVQLDRFDQLDDQSSPSIVPEPESEKIGKTTAARRSLVSPMRWTTRWRTRHRRARK
jgi:hypothetical protein